MQGSAPGFGCSAPSDLARRSLRTFDPDVGTLLATHMRHHV